LREYFLIETGDDPDFLRSERHAPNYLFYKRAYTSIKSAPNMAELQKKVDGYRGYEKAEFTPEQLANLDALAASRERELTGGRNNGGGNQRRQRQA